MKHFAKSILNYFATFNETRFRFGTRQLAYQWGDQDQHSLDVLDLAIFPEFQARILDSIAANADLVSIYPKVGGTADNIRTVFGSPAEKRLYNLLLQTPFYQRHRGQCRLVAQFEIGKYIREEYRKFIPPYRVDFLLTLTRNGKERSLIIEYDGVEYHTRNPDLVTAHNFDQEYLEYDVQRQLELEGFGYGFLRINKFSLVPRRAGESAVDVLNEKLERAFV